MKLRKWVPALAAMMLALMTVTAASGEAKIVRPIPPDPEMLDAADGTFDVQVANMDSFDREKTLILELYRSDTYDPEEIRTLSPGDILVINGEEYTVEEVAKRDDSWFDDGEDRTVYDVSTKEECWDGIWFLESDGAIYPHIGDWTPVTYIRTVSVPLPLPAGFAYFDYPGGEDAIQGGEEEFLQDLRDHTPAFFSPYNTYVCFSDGELTECHSWSYPWGPETESGDADDDV